MSDTKMMKITTDEGVEREVEHQTWEMLHYCVLGEEQIIEALYWTLNACAKGPYPTSRDEIAEEDAMPIMALTGAWVQIRSIKGILQGAPATD